ncbi:MAG: hypothetical protein ACPLRY_08015 [Candidatus Bathyarchaeales archaeon]
MIVRAIFLGKVCAEGVKDQNPSISEEELIELVRERLMFEKRLRGNLVGLYYM